MWLIWSIAILPGLACAYFFFIRPLLEKLPAFKQFYAEADGFWQKVWAICGKSITMAWSYILAGIGAAVQLIDPIASALGDPDLRSQITGTLQADPKLLGYVAMGISLVTIAARLRSISKD